MILTGDVVHANIYITDTNVEIWEYGIVQYSTNSSSGWLYVILVNGQKYSMSGNSLRLSMNAATINEMVLL